MTVRLYARAPRAPRVPRGGPRAVRAAGVARILPEHQRLHRDGNGLRGHADAPQVDVVEIPEDDSVDHQDLALDAHFVAQDRAQRLRDVAVDHDVYGHALRNGAGESPPYPFRQSGDALVGWRALPAQRQRRFALTFHQIESLEVRADRPRERVRVDALSANIG